MINAIGIPLLLPNDYISERSDALLKAAYLYRVPAFIYSLDDVVKFEQNGTLRALFWDEGEYRECYTDLPKYTEIFSSITMLRRSHPKEIGWLNEHTVFTDDIGINKFNLQLKLLFSDLSECAIPTIVVHSYDELCSSASMFPVAFLKPLSGTQGIGTMKIEKKNDLLLYYTPESAGELTQQIFSTYYPAGDNDNITRLLLEPYLNILDDNGRAVDFRCLVSLNGKGKWQNVLTYARIGGSGVASNVSHGGSVNFAKSILEAMFPGRGVEKISEINRIALRVAEIVRNESQNPVSWLGVDICIDRSSNQIYVIEANSKPDTKIIGPWPLSLVRAQYFKYLLSQDD